jgi:deoxyribodipyrimidine photo-lyase
MVDMARKTLVWLRQDLRLQDHPALVAAAKRGEIVPVFIWSPGSEGAWKAGGASRWWLHHALVDLAKAFEAAGGSLIFRSGDPLRVLRALIEETGADAVFWSRRYEPAAIEHDSAVKAALRDDGLEVKSFNASLLFEPWEVANGSGDPYRVFTPFSKCLLKRPMPEPVELPGELQFASAHAEDLASFGLLPEQDWDRDFYEAWDPTRAGAEARFARFLDGPVKDYGEGRDLPAEDGTSRLSPYLHFGQISPREVLSRLGSETEHKSGAVFRNEILWREFGYHILFHFPHTPEEPLQAQFKDFPWQPEASLVKAWRQGQTGYPIVDAGMRQLWKTGWMHNRVRMIVASLLVKHLLQSWQVGAAWFWDTLVDADLASNTLGWQWAGGCGADAAPYFRIFNPIIQGKKFDAGGAYVRRWVPELKGLPDKYIHAPWEAPEALRRKLDYPEPIIEHSAGRERALEAFAAYKEKRNG